MVDCVGWQFPTLVFEMVQLKELRNAVLAGLSGQAEVLQFPGLSPVSGRGLVAKVVAP